MGSHPTPLVSMLSGGKSQGSTKEAVKETSEWMKTALGEAQTSLERTQCEMASALNRPRRLEQYKVGNEMILNIANLRSYYPYLLAKLWTRWVGPFMINQVVVPMAYNVDLPLGWQIHPVFYIDRLEQYVHSEESLREVEPPPPVLVEDHLEYEVEDLLRHRIHGACGQYLILWKGYPFAQATWEYEQDLMKHSRYSQGLSMPL